MSVTRGTVDRVREHDPSQAPYGQPQYLFEEYERAAEIVKASPEWRAAMTRRGLVDRIDLAFCSPLAPGFTGRADEVGRRVIRVADLASAAATTAGAGDTAGSPDAGSRPGG